VARYEVGCSINPHLTAYTLDYNMKALPDMTLKTSVCRVIAAAVLVGLPLSPARAGDVSGRVWVAQKQRPAAGASVSLNCAGAQFAAGVADGNGVYRLRVPAQAPAGARECQLLVTFSGKDSNPLRVFTRSDSVTLNLELHDGSLWAIVQK
jgi:hypothetical protein